MMLIFERRHIRINRWFSVVKAFSLLLCHAWIHSDSWWDLAWLLASIRVTALLLVTPNFILMIVQFDWCVILYLCRQYCTFALRRRWVCGASLLFIAVIYRHHHILVLFGLLLLHRIRARVPTLRTHGSQWTTLLLGGQCANITLLWRGLGLLLICGIGYRRRCLLRSDILSLVTRRRLLLTERLTRILLLLTTLSLCYYLLTITWGLL